MSKKKITTEEVKHIADLCNLTLSANEIEKLSQMLGDTLDYVEMLNELNTSNIDETYQVTGLANVFQNKDDPQDTLSQKEALQNAQEVIDDMFATEAIFDR
jgi:aspartyl-tRNA(Asn)/glutamyl-tRNA(Gln) amidotransferase subunit C